MVKVDSDPAQVIVNHASFRVHFAPKAQSKRPLRDPARVPAAGAARRRAPVVWSGRAAPGATGLLQAVRGLEAPGAAGESLDVGATQVIPRIDEDTMPTPVVVAPRAPLADSGGGAETALLQAVRQSPHGYAQGAYGDDGFDEFERGYDDGYEGEDGPESRGQRHGADQVRHAYYPGRRMNLGVVLLPLRVFLGFISVYAGMGKLCDPVYFDGGERGSMMKWLNSLHPWALAEPLRAFALQHPVGAGLSVAFLQIVVGVLTMLGLWQRVAAVFGALLSAALLLTVSWQTVPAYDAPDFIYLAAWSPLITGGVLGGCRPPQRHCARGGGDRDDGRPGGPGVGAAREQHRAAQDERGKGGEGRAAQRGCRRHHRAGRAWRAAVRNGRPPRSTRTLPVRPPQDQSSHSTHSVSPASVLTSRSSTSTSPWPTWYGKSLVESGRTRGKVASSSTSNRRSGTSAACRERSPERSVRAITSTRRSVSTTGSGPAPVTTSRTVCPPAGTSTTRPPSSSTT
ncbi:hypothetical protein A8W25_16640 [Streptomyces sp. ERV7]|nr:hypothetical protein A8W25_16640 [Streptomyces sp. ERV7]